MRTQAAYLAASVVALGVDFAVTLGLTYAYAPAFVAAAVGYALGLGVHWGLSVRFVFAGELAASGPARARQGAMFVLSGLVGLCATVLIYSGALALGLWAGLAKALATAVSYVTVYFIRRRMVFSLRA